MADLTSQVGIRDSKFKKGLALRVPALAWADFVGYVQSGQVDFGMIDN